MKNRSFALLALLLVVPLMFALIGCGDDDDAATTKYRVTLETSDTDANGTVNDFSVYVYNSGSALANITTGTIDSVTINTYGASGVTNTVVDGDNFQNTTNSWTTTTYDADGNKATVLYWSDANNDDALTAGEETASIAYTYDANGNLLEQRNDADGDLAASAGDTYTTYTYDANNNKLTALNWTDAGVDGYTAGEETASIGYTYDASNNLTEQRNDADGDLAASDADSYVTYTYDANNNILTETEWTDNYAGGATDPGYDVGEADAITTNTYDANGNKTRTDTDADGSGTVTAGDTETTWTYDASGNAVTRVDWSDVGGDADGVLDAGEETAAYRYTYDKSDNLTLSESDADVTGTYETFTRNTYDASGNKTMIEQGKNVSIEHYTYNATGVIGAEVDVDYSGASNDTASDMVITATYDATCGEFATVVEYTEAGTIGTVEAGEKTGTVFTYDADCETSQEIEWTDTGVDGYTAGTDEDSITQYTSAGGLFTIEVDPDTTFLMGDTAGEVTMIINAASETQINSATMWVDADGSGALNAGDTFEGVTFAYDGKNILNSLEWTDANDDGIYAAGEEAMLTTYHFSNGLMNQVDYDKGTVFTYDSGDTTDTYTYKGSKVETYKSWVDAGTLNTVDTGELSGINYTYTARGVETRTDWDDKAADGFTAGTDEGMVKAWTYEAGKIKFELPEGDEMQFVEMPELPDVR